MSYMLNASCHVCEKFRTCKDCDKVQKAITEIHQTTFEEGDMLASDWVVVE